MFTLFVRSAVCCLRFVALDILILHFAFQTTCLEGEFFSAFSGDVRVIILTTYRANDFMVCNFFLFAAKLSFLRYNEHGLPRGRLLGNRKEERNTTP